MSNINPYSFLASQGLYSLTTQVAFPVQTSLIVKWPKALQNSLQDTQLKGEIISKNNDGSTNIKTSQGIIAVKLSIPLPIGAKLSLQISSTNGQSKEVIVQQNIEVKTSKNPIQSDTRPIIKAPINSSALNDVKNLQNTAAKASISTASGTNNSQNLQQGQLVRITPLPASQQSLNFTTNNNPKTVLPNINTNNLQSPTLTKTSLPLRLPINSTAQNTNMMSVARSTILAPANLPIISSPQINILVPKLANHLPIQIPTTVSISPVNLGTNPFTVNSQNNTNNLQIHDARITTITVPNTRILQPNRTGKINDASNTKGTSILSTMKAGQMIAYATGQKTPDGLPIIQIPSQSGESDTFYTLNYPVPNLTAGTQLILTPVSNSKTGYSIKINAPQWQTMQDVMSIASQNLTIPQAQSLQQLLPNTLSPKQFPAAALLFLSAANGGDLSGWLGTHASNIFKNGTPHARKMLDKLSNDISKSTGTKPSKSDPSQPNQIQNSSDWRGYIIPLSHENNILECQLWIKDFNEEQNNDDDIATGTRFVVDLNLSRMGNIQLDGLVQPTKNHLDLVLKTQTNLSNLMQDHVEKLWSKTLLAMGMQGTIEFREI